MIEIKNVSKVFGSRVAVDNLSLNIESGIYGLVGQNGAGKSTLFRIIAGVYDIQEGTVEIDLHTSTTTEAKKLVFFLPDDPFVDRNDNIKDIYDYYSCFYEFDEERFVSLIDKFSLPKNVAISKFSKGMKRQTFVCLALSIKVKYLLLDEAFDGLDPITLEVIKDELLKAKEEGKVIVISSHNISSLEKLVDTFVMITKGKIAQNDTSETLGTNYVKFQAMFKYEVTEEALRNVGLDVVSFKKYGSIFNIVVMDEENIEEKINKVAPTTLLERIPIDAEEIVKLNMMVARKVYGDEDK
ncbi:MAG: ABC transporter ATP-binding protein [Bacilli bacterium]|nr:ABC transporter ATP-binding protein [Bacilli bacterium]